MDVRGVDVAAVLAFPRQPRDAVEFVGFVGHVQLAVHRAPEFELRDEASVGIRVRVRAPDDVERVGWVHPAGLHDVRGDDRARAGDPGVAVHQRAPERDARVG